MSVERMPIFKKESNENKTAGNVINIPLTENHLVDGIAITLLELVNELLLLSIIIELFMLHSPIIATNEIGIIFNISDVFWINATPFIDIKLIANKLPKIINPPKNTYPKWMNSCEFSPLIPRLIALYKPSTDKKGNNPTRIA